MSVTVDLRKAAYVHRYRLGFADTDAAGIAFTGRFPAFALDAIEGWFRDRLGTDWYRLNMDDRIGTPFVHVSMDLRASLTPRDVLCTTVRLRRAGRSSLEFAVAGDVEADVRHCFDGRFVCVFADPVSGGDGPARSTPIPDRFRAAVDREVAIGAATSG